MAGFRWLHVGVASLLTVATVTFVGVVQQAGAAGGGGAGVVSSLTPITPCRLADTRADASVGVRATPIGQGESVTLTVWGTNGQCTIPSTATGVSANVTAVGPTAAGYLTLFPSDAPRPLASNLNFVAGSPPTPNAVTVRLSADGKLNVFNNAGSVDVIIDLAGYYSPTPAGPAGPAGPQGPAGPTTRITKAQIATLRWDQDPGRAATVTVGNGPQGVAYDGTSIWVTNSGSSTVSRINPTTLTVTPVTVGIRPLGVAYDGTSIWVANYISNTVSRINPTTLTVTPVTVGNGPVGVAYDGSNIWVTNYGSNTASRLVASA
ncbi:MAG: YncE family protein [Acidimicrobiales bacterium]